jgi:hypothetical protein
MSLYDNDTGMNLIDVLGGYMKEGEKGANQAAASELAFKKEYAEQQVEISNRGAAADESVASSLRMMAETMARRGGGAKTDAEKEEERLQKLRDDNVQFLLKGLPVEHWPGPNRVLYRKEQIEEV